MFLYRKSKHHRFNTIRVKITTELFVTKQADAEVHVGKKMFLIRNSVE